MKAIVYVGVSLDGFIADVNGDLAWLEKFADDEVSRGYIEFMESVDAVVVGRATFEKVFSYPSWPYTRKVFVLSTTLTAVPKHLAGKAEIISMEPREVLTYVGGKGFTLIYVDGGRTIQRFLNDDCIDEMVISRVPLILGSGIPLFSSLDNPLSFAHVHTDVYSNGLVQSRYIRTRR